MGDSAVSCRDPYNGDTERVASDAKAWNERGGITVYLLWAVTDAGTRLINVFSTRDRAMVESAWYAGDSFVQPATAVPHEGGAVTTDRSAEVREIIADALCVYRLGRRWDVVGRNVDDENAAGVVLEHLQAAGILFRRRALDPNDTTREELQ